MSDPVGRIPDFAPAVGVGRRRSKGGTKRMRTRISLGLAAVAIALAADTARAGGFELRAYDAKMAGMSNAFTAVADTPATVAQNPAGMSQLDGIQGSASIE